MRRWVRKPKMGLPKPRLGLPGVRFGMSRKAVTLNIESSCIRILATKGKRVEKWATAPLEPGLVQDGLISDPPALGARVKGLLEASGIRGKKVIASLSGLYSVSRILDVPKLSGDSLEKAVLEEARKTIPVTLEELYLSWQTIAGREDGQQAFLLGVPRSLLDSQIEALHETGIRPYIMDLKAAALARVVNRKEALIIDIEPHSFDIIVVVDFIPQLVRAVSQQRNALEMEQRVQRVAEALERTTRFYDSNHPERPLSPATPLFLTGQLADDPLIVDMVQARAKYPIESLVTALECPPGLSVQQYAVNIGLALRQMAPRRRLRGGADGLRGLNLNILPYAYRRRITAKQGRFLAGAVAAIALLFPVYRVASDSAAQTAQLQSQLSILEQQLELRNIRDQRIAQLESDIAAANAAADDIRDDHATIASNQGVFMETLDFVESTLDELTPGISLTAKRFTSGSLSVEGTDEIDQGTLLSYIDALEAAGFARPVTGNLGPPFSITVTWETPRFWAGQ